MKRTVNVNIAGLGFTIDQDGYVQLDAYLKDVASRIADANERKEMIEDIEARIADHFNEVATSQSRVISIENVRSALDRIGSPDLFGPKSKSGFSQQIDDLSDKFDDFTRKFSQPVGEAPRRLMRDKQDSVFGGVCSGVSAYLGVDTSIVRILAVVLLFFFGASLWVYLLCLLVIPAARTPEELEMMIRMKQSR